MFIIWSLPGYGYSQFSPIFRETGKRAVWAGTSISLLKVEKGWGDVVVAVWYNRTPSFFLEYQK